MTRMNARAIADRITLRVAEIPDRFSPDDQPDMMLVTPDELTSIVTGVIEEELNKEEKGNQEAEVTADKQIILSVADGPEHIELYTSSEEAVTDFASDLTALYMTASVNGAFVKLGPFHLLRKQLVNAVTGRLSVSE